MEFSKFKAATVQTSPVFLNAEKTIDKAPTENSLNITSIEEAFEAVLIRGRAIKLHPLVCSAFNADFDGDEMNLHMPQDDESELELKTLAAVKYQIINPANNKSIVGIS